MYVVVNWAPHWARKYSQEVSLSLCRAEGILNRGNVDAFALEESQNLSIFFATNNSITLHLKKNLEEVGGEEGEREREREDNGW